VSSESLNGDQTFAHGALEAGVSAVTSYPGSPSSGVLESLLDLTEPDELYIEWSTNEKVAPEAAIGVSLRGRRVLRRIAF
jgi:indolepyruvate ferredoxin oxidoreductase alpha subunit